MGDKLTRLLGQPLLPPSSQQYDERVTFAVAVWDGREKQVCGFSARARLFFFPFFVRRAENFLLFLIILLAGQEEEGGGSPLSLHFITVSAAFLASVSFLEQGGARPARS